MATPQPAAPNPTPSKYTATVYPAKPREVPPGLASCIRRLEDALEMPVWFLIQAGGREDLQEIDVPTKNGFCSPKSELPEGQHIALVIDSPGGSAKGAYQIAMCIRKRCGGFIAVVPEFAKSAATLLALGADRLILGRHAELGPLDAQVYDREREEWLSALDEVQALERLNAFALQALDSSMLLLKRRTGKTFNALLPGVQHSVGQMLRPLFDKIDTVHYTQMARLLKVAEEYAIRLLQPKYNLETATEIARRLVHQYPQHEFFIGAEEASSINKDLVERPEGEVASIMNDLIEHLQSVTFIGKLQEL